MTSTGEVSEVSEHRDAGTPSDRADLRRFLIATAGFTVLFGIVGRAFGEDIALRLLDTPTTTSGWRFIGWLISAPPAVVTMIVWHERRRLTAQQRRTRAHLLAAWIGLSMFVLPARVTSVHSQFGTGALVGDPLSEGWAWGALAAIIGLVFTGLVLVVLYRTVGAPTREHRDLTVRFLERAWLVLLVVSLGFALYGARTDVFHGGS